MRFTVAVDILLFTVTSVNVMRLTDTESKKQLVQLYALAVCVSLLILTLVRSKIYLCVVSNDGIATEVLLCVFVRVNV